MIWAPANWDGCTDAIARHFARSSPRQQWYEEYHPYGSTAWHAANSTLAPGLKRYRYTGKEKDDETGLYYHGARFYACWLGRWCSSDPIGMGDGVNRYAYVRGNPVGMRDDDGKARVPAAGGSSWTAWIPSPSEMLHNTLAKAGVAAQFANDMTIAGPFVGDPVLDRIPNESFQSGRQLGRDAAEVAGYVEMGAGLVTMASGVALEGGATGGGMVVGSVGGPPGQAAGGAFGGAIAATPAAGLIVVGGLITAHGLGVAGGTTIRGDVDAPNYSLSSDGPPGGGGRGGGGGGSPGTGTASGKPPPNPDHPHGTKKDGTPKARTGPKTEGGPHNNKISEVIAREVAAGFEHIGGGTLKELVLKTKGGLKDARRPDASFQDTVTGAIHHVNVGLSNIRQGVEKNLIDPIIREREALADLRTFADVKIYFEAYFK